eukprot:1898635-Pyramimonas_sp.AAC.2
MLRPPKACARQTSMRSSSASAASPSKVQIAPVTHYPATWPPPTMAATPLASAPGSVVADPQRGRPSPVTGRRARSTTRKGATRKWPRSAAGDLQ